MKWREVEWREDGKGPCSAFVIIGVLAGAVFAGATAGLLNAWLS